MSTQQGIQIQSQRVAKLVSIPKPTLCDDYILVKTKAVALNPADYNIMARGTGNPGSLIGCDFAGVVEAVGKNVSQRLKPSDRVAGVVHGGKSSLPSHQSNPVPLQ